MMRVSVVATGIDAVAAASEVPLPRRRMAEPLHTTPAQQVAPAPAFRHEPAATVASEPAPQQPQQAQPPAFRPAEDRGLFDRGVAAARAAEDLPPPAYQPQAQTAAAQNLHVEDEAQAFVAPRPRAPGTPSPEALARLQAAVNRAPGHIPGQASASQRAARAGAASGRRHAGRQAAFRHQLASRPGWPVTALTRPSDPRRRRASSRRSALPTTMSPEPTPIRSGSRFRPSCVGRPTEHAHIAVKRGRLPPALFPSGPMFWTGWAGFPARLRRSAADMFQSVAKSELSLAPRAPTSSVPDGVSLPRVPEAGTTLQTTIKSSVSFAGIGLHSGRPVRMTINPASAEYGIWFRRTDVGGRDAMVPARWDAVVAGAALHRDRAMPPGSPSRPSSM